MSPPDVATGPHVVEDIRDYRVGPAVSASKLSPMRIKNRASATLRALT
jgi:hypothetical protein